MPGQPLDSSTGERYKPLDEYGVIGDRYGLALVGSDGSIDWFCLPDMRSPSVFGAILDADKGGRFRIGPVQTHNRKQLYLPDTNVLYTRFLGGETVVELVDFMPMGDAGIDGPRRIVRRVNAVRGPVQMRLDCTPAFDYARAEHDVVRRDDGILFDSPDAWLTLASDGALEVDDASAHATFEIQQGETRTFVLEGGSGEVPEDLSLDVHIGHESFQATVDHWRSWVSSCTYHGRWRENVVRSALVLKMMTYAPTGAMMAAGTTSLPENVGGRRNWDYRFTWMRDAAFTVYALVRIGFDREAEDFVAWLHERCTASEDQGLHPLYGLDGSVVQGEVELPHLEGYRGSQPVRIGNRAGGQKQLDVYGEVMDAVYLSNKYASWLSTDMWAVLRAMIDWLCDHWDETDQGVWEIRSRPRHHVYSRAMCWVAFDRAIRIAHKRGYPADLVRWRRERDKIHDQVLTKGWDEEARTFRMQYGSDAVDTSLLLLPLVFFVSPGEPRMTDTVDTIRRRLAADNLLHRYDPEEVDDGLGPREGAFTPSSFWLVEALTRAGRLEEARILFEKTLGYASRLGLFSEEVSHGGELLGNFPQALSHLALISAAVNLDKALGTA